MAPAARMDSASSCRFRFGAGWLGEEHDYSGVDYLTVWIGQGSSSTSDPSCSSSPCFNKWWHGAMLREAERRSIGAAYYGYIIAFLARERAGLHDCDVATPDAPSLCTHGAGFIRENPEAILDAYSHFAERTAATVGQQAEVLWLIEPDFHQYSSYTQHGGGLSHEDMVNLYLSITQRILAHLPNAQLSMDISPWVADQEAWLAPFIARCQVDYLHTSGGRTTAASPFIRAEALHNPVTWAGVHSASGGRGIIADTGYGVGGISMGHNEQWDDVRHLQDRIADGVVAVTQANYDARRAVVLEKARNSLAVLRECTWRDKWPPAYGDGFGSTNGNSRAAMQLLVPALLACVVALVIRNMYSKCQRASKSSALGASSVEARCHHTSARPQASSTSKGVAGVLGKNRGRRGTALSPPFTMLAPDCGEAAGVELKGVSRPILRAGRSMESSTIDSTDDASTNGGPLRLKDRIGKVLGGDLETADVAYSDGTTAEPYPKAPIVVVDGDGHPCATFLPSSTNSNKCSGTRARTCADAVTSISEMRRQSMKKDRRTQSRGRPGEAAKVTKTKKKKALGSSTSTVEVALDDTEIAARAIRLKGGAPLTEDDSSSGPHCMLRALVPSQPSRGPIVPRTSRRAAVLLDSKPHVLIGQSGH